MREILDGQDLQQVTDDASDVIGLFDVEGRPLWVNAPGEYIRTSESTTHDPFGHVHAGDRERVRAEFSTVARTGEPRWLEFRVPQDDGTVRRVLSEATAVRDGAGRIVAVMRVGRNVTEERRHEAELKATLAAIFDHAPIGISLTDADARFIRTNRRFRDMLGYTEEELYRMTGWDVVHKDDAVENARLRDELWSGKRRDFAWERRYIRKNGEILWVQNTVSLIRDAEGRPRYAVALVEDITQRRLASEAIHATAGKLHALTRRLVELQEVERRDIARELHDRVGQTLTAMRINMDIIRMRLGEGGDAVARSRNDDSIELIESTFRAVQNVMYELRPPMIDEHGLVAAMRWYARSFGERTGIRVTVRGSEDWRCGPDIELALFRIAQEALNNVARHAKARDVSIELREIAPIIQLVIEDDGVGFDREANRTERAGYGMITMRERAEAVGGTFEARSVPGQGTRITVAVPRKP